MPYTQKHTTALKRKGMGFKLSLTNFALTAALTSTLIGAIGFTVSSSIAAREETEMFARTKIIADLINATDRDLRERVKYYSSALHKNIEGELALVPGFWTEINGHQTPALTVDGNLVNGQTHLVDTLTQATGARFTIFAMTGDEFYRVSTSLLDDKGQRSMGTTLDKNTPAYKQAIQGKPYTGLNTLFGKQYMTHYQPLFNANNEVVGVTLAGMDFSNLLDSYKTTIKDMTIGKTGYFYVLDVRPGSSYGNLIIHPAMEGQNILASKDASGREFIREMLDKKEGVMTYPWRNETLGETGARDKLAAFITLPNWNWLLAGGTYIDEYTGYVNDLIKLFAALGLTGLLAVSALWLALIRKMVTRPIGEVINAADAIASGDLSGTLRVQRDDEIGHLVESINRINSGIAQAVDAVRVNAYGVADASDMIAHSNAELSARTDSQASALTQTAASMEQMEATVKQNADNASAANQLADQASKVARRGGDVVNVAVQTMQGIHQASQRIADIVNVIDAIAFQTNILALNASVEAARAGEQGKGFAVVASEVRNLSARSASAAKEIKDLIMDSVERVEQGTVQVNEAGETMREIMQSIMRVTDIVGEISTASSEQSDGVGQIAQAITQIDGVTQHNVAQVEQMSEATQRLGEQAEALVNAVAAFKTHGTLTRPPNVDKSMMGMVLRSGDARIHNAVPGSPREFR